MDNTVNAFREFEQAGWEDSDTAARYDKYFSDVTSQSLDALLDDAAVSSATRVLDVGTGAGYVAAAALARGADPVGIDFSSTQIKLARLKFPGIRFEQADAERIPFESATFDAVVCAFGMCHLSTPDNAIREAARVLKSGGRIAFTVWDAPDRAEAFGTLYAAIRAYGSMDVGLPAGPNFFLYSAPDHCKTALVTAGFELPKVRQIPQVLRMDAPDELFEMMAGGTVRAAATLRAQSAQAIDAIRSAVRDAVFKYKSGNRFEIPMPAIVASAVKP